MLEIVGEFTSTISTICYRKSSSSIEFIRWFHEFSKFFAKLSLFILLEVATQAVLIQAFNTNFLKPFQMQFQLKFYFIKLRVLLIERRPGSISAHILSLKFAMMNTVVFSSIEDIFQRSQVSYNFCVDPELVE